jgi:hypothetical protein
VEYSLSWDLTVDFRSSHARFHCYTAERVAVLRSGVVALVLVAFVADLAASTPLALAQDEPVGHLDLTWAAQFLAVGREDH